MKIPTFRWMKEQSAGSMAVIEDEEVQLSASVPIRPIPAFAIINPQVLHRPDTDRALDRKRIESTEGCIH